MTTPDAAPAAQPEVDPATLRKAIAASAVGNAVEWFDYGIYAYSATYVAAALFPENDDAIFYALAAFAVSFLLRPLGGFFWGPLGDRIGRKRVLAMTIMIMSVATLAVGLIPSHASIGIAAPVLLYLCRMVQGFSTGGEYAGAATFMAEYAPDRRRGFLGSFLEVGTLAGFSGGALLVLLFTTILSEDQMGDWGWRVPFLVAAPLGLVGMYLRSKMEDSPVFRELEETQDAEQRTAGVFTELFTKHLRAVLTLGGLVIALNVVNYTLLSYMPTYLQGEIDFTDNQALVVPIVVQLVMMLVLPLVGALSDRLGRRPLWLVSLVGLIVLSVPMYTFAQGGFAQAMVAFAVLGLLYTPQLATISATFPAMFPTHVRFAGVAIGYNVSTALFGGTAPAVNEELIRSTGNNVFPAWYMAGACVLGLVAWSFMVETKGESLRGTETPGTDETREISR